MAENLNFERVLVAEDELSELYQQRATIETPEQMAEAALRSQEDNFRPAIQEIAEICDGVLEELGFPASNRQVLHLGDGAWEPLPSREEFRARKTPWQIVNGHWLSREFSSGFSDEWYAGRLGFKCHLLLAHYDKGDAGKPFFLQMVMEIATLRSDWRWRQAHKAKIVKSIEQRKQNRINAPKGGQSTVQRSARKKEALAEVALKPTEITRWVGKSDKEQAKHLKALARKVERADETGELRFIAEKTGNSLSLNWYQDLLGEWRSNGRLSQALGN